MDCLDGQIGVVGLTGYDTAKSGLFINDLPGITLNQLDKIKDDTEDYQDAASAWERIYVRGKKNFEHDVIAFNRRNFKRTSIISSRITGQVTKTLLTAQGVRTGLYFNLTNYSPSLEIFFNAAQFYLSTPDTVTVEVYDATTGLQLLSESQTGTANALLTIPIQEGFTVHEYPKLFVCYADTGLSVYKVTDYAYDDFLISTRKQVSTASSVTASNLSGGNTGMVLNYNMKCGVITWICQNIDVFIKPFWYKLGIEFLKERFGSERFNRFTMINLDKAQALLEDFEMEYKKSLEDTLKTMYPTDDGYCFECNKGVNKRYMMA